MSSLQKNVKDIVLYTIALTKMFYANNCTTLIHQVPPLGSELVYQELQYTLQ